MNKALYPANWREISQRIRLRAGDCCEVCGLPNGARIVRNLDCLEEVLILDEDFVGYRDMNGTPFRRSELPGWVADAKDVTIVLTVAHLDHDPSNNTDANLKCLCQLHHLRHDARYHAQNAALTRGKRKREVKMKIGQKALWID